MAQKKNYILDPSDPQIIFVLGGPGSGKGTQCERLVRDYHFHHVSVGDVIREEANNGTPEGKELSKLMSQGTLVSDELVVNLLHKKIKTTKAQKYLIDGFPRNIAQAKLLERTIKEIDLILNLHVDEEALIARLMERAKTSGRVDDNPETIKKRIHTFHSETEPVVDYYRKFGKIKHIDSSKSIDEVYQQVKRAIKPNIIFFWGPPGVGKSSAAKALADKTGYLYIDLEEFTRQHKIKTPQEKTNKLIEYCDTVPHMCIVVDSFFYDFEQTKVFFTHFVEPQLVFNLSAPRDDVLENIHKYYSSEKDRVFQKQQYEEYIKQREQILSFLQTKSFFKPIDASQHISQIIFNCLEVMRPLTLVAFEHHGKEIAQEYYGQLERERGFIYCDIDELVHDEVERGTKLGKKMQPFNQSGQRIPPKYKTELVAKVMFNEPDNKKFIFTNFPSSQIDFTTFESELYPIDYLVSFEEPGKLHQFNQSFTPTLNYFSQGKEIIIRRPALDILDSYITQRSKFGFVSGPQFGGKSAISEHLKKQFGYEVIEWAPLIEELKVKLSPDENPLEEVSYAQVEKYFEDRLSPKKNKGTVLFDGFPYTEAQLQSFVGRVGLPSFIIHLSVNNEFLTKRFKLKLETEELDEDNQNKLVEAQNKATSLGKFWNDLASKNFGTSLYQLDTNFSLDTTKLNVNTIFQKRVFVVHNYCSSNNAQILADQKNLFQNVCRRYNITFVDVMALLQTVSKNTTNQNYSKVHSQYSMRWTDQKAEFPSNYSPDLIISVIKGFLDQQKKPTRDVLLFGYPSADAPERNKDQSYFPRPSDEIQQIEKFLGPIRIVTIFTDERVDHKIQDPEWPLEAPQKKEVKKGEGEEGGEEEPPAEEENKEEEGGKPKFNIYEHKWTQSNGVPKSLPQWYVKLKKTKRFHYSLTSGGYEHSFDKFEQFINSINEENEENKEQQDYRKVNLFVQLRLDSFNDLVEEEDPVEQEPVEGGEQEEAN